MKKVVAMPSCLSCGHSEEYAPPRCRSTVKHRCKIWRFDVNAGSIPGLTMGCNRFAAPEIPFAYESSPAMPAHLL